MSNLSIGIDLGTTTTIVSAFRNGRPEAIKDAATKTPLIPSVVALDRRGGLLVGQAAIDRGLPGKIVREAKRDMGTERIFELGDHRLRPEEVAAMVLRYAKENAERFLGETIEEAVVTVPAYFGDLERRATHAAAEIAGLRVKRLINEPTAAAMAYGLDRLEEETVAMVVDLGGGTLDVTVFEMIAGVLDVRTTHGDKLLGGSDMDKAVMAWAQRSLPVGTQSTPQGEEALKQRAEAAKKELSSSGLSEVFVSNYGLSAGAEQDVSADLTAPAFNAEIEPLVRRCLAIIDETLAKGGLQKSDVKKLLLVGGSTYVPRVREAVENHMALSAEHGLDPDLAVSAGAAISAALADDRIDPDKGIVVQDVSGKGMGVLVVEDVGNQEMLVFSELIAPNTSVPYHVRHEYRLRRPDQTEMSVEVVQVDRTGVVMPDDTIPTGVSLEIKDIPFAPYGQPHRVDVDFHYNADMMVSLTASIPGTGRSATIHLNTTGGALGAGALGEAVTRLDSLWETSPLAGRHQKIVQRAEAVLKDAPANAEGIEAALVELKAAIAGNDADGAQSARERLTDQLARI